MSLVRKLWSIRCDAEIIVLSRSGNYSWKVMSGLSADSSVDSCRWCSLYQTPAMHMSCNWYRGGQQDLNVGVCSMRVIEFASVRVTMGQN